MVYTTDTVDATSYPRGKYVNVDVLEEYNYCILTQHHRKINNVNHVPKQKIKHPLPKWGKQAT